MSAAGKARVQAGKFTSSAVSFTPSPCKGSGDGRRASPCRSRMTQLPDARRNGATSSVIGSTGRPKSVQNRACLPRPVTPKTTLSTPGMLMVFGPNFTWFHLASCAVSGKSHVPGSSLSAEPIGWASSRQQRKRRFAFADDEPVQVIVSDLLRSAAHRLQHSAWWSREAHLGWRQVRSAPCCGGHRVIIQLFERWRQPRTPAKVPIIVWEIAR